MTNADAAGKNQIKKRDSQQDLTIITLNLILKHRYAEGNDLFVWYIEGKMVVTRMDTSKSDCHLHSKYMIGVL